MRRGLIFFFCLTAFVWLATPGYAKLQLAPMVSVQRAVSPSPSPQPTPPAKMEYFLPYPGMLPDHPFYIFKVTRDRIVMIFTKDQHQLISLYVLLADKRLAMGQALVAKGKAELAATTISKGEKYLLRAVDTLRELEDADRTPDVGLVNAVARSVNKHEEVVQELVKEVSGEAASSMGLSLQNAQEAGKQLKEFRKRRNIAM